MGQSMTRKGRSEREKESVGWPCVRGRGRTYRERGGLRRVQKSTRAPTDRHVTGEGGARRLEHEQNELHFWWRDIVRIEMTPPPAAAGPPEAPPTDIREDDAPRAVTRRKRQRSERTAINGSTPPAEKESGTVHRDNTTTTPFACFVCFLFDSFHHICPCLCLYFFWGEITAARGGGGAGTQRRRSPPAKTCVCRGGMVVVD